MIRCLYCLALSPGCFGSRPTTCTLVSPMRARRSFNACCARCTRCASSRAWRALSASSSLSACCLLASKLFWRRSACKYRSSPPAAATASSLSCHCLFASAANTLLMAGGIEKTVSYIYTKRVAHRRQYNG